MVINQLFGALMALVCYKISLVDLKVRSTNVNRTFLFVFFTFGIMPVFRFYSFSIGILI